MWTPTGGDFTADHVVIATGGYDIRNIPPYAHSLPADIVQVHSVDYRNPDMLPPGEVAVVGTGQSGVQLMEDLHLAGRKVHLCVGPAPRAPRKYRGRDVTEWLFDLGYYDLTVDRHPEGEKARERTNHYMTGRGGGAEIDLRKFAASGVRLYGSLKTIRGATLEFNGDLKRNLDEADAVYLSIRSDIDKYIESRGIDAPEEPPFTPAWAPSGEVASLDCRAAGVTSIVWACGFRPDYTWIELPAFDGRGAPKYNRGVSTAEGLHFIGLPWLHTWGSGRFLGIAEDAQYLAEQICRNNAA